MAAKRRAGSDFEITVYKALTKALGRGELGFSPQFANVFHQPSYYSRDREKNIFFDVSVELKIQGAADPSILWIWECKDYTSLVPVDDVEEFHSKLDQVGADRTKGTIITTRGFQESALNYARSKGIGLARLMPEEQVDWVLYRTTPAELISLSAGPEEIRRALTDATYKATNQDLFALSTSFRTVKGLTWGTYLELQMKEWDVLNVQ